MSFSDVQETVFWHQLNKRLLKITRGDKKFAERHRFLQDFSLRNSLFSKINSSFFAPDIPLAFITNFVDTSFITLHHDGWERCLKFAFRKISRVTTFNLQSAISRSLEVLSEYDKKYPKLFGANNETIDDEDTSLFTFLNDFMKEKENVGWNVPRFVSKLHLVKTGALRFIMKQYPSHISFEILEDCIHMDFQRCPERSELENQYKERFCKKASEAVSSFWQYPVSQHLFATLKSQKRRATRNSPLFEAVQYEAALLHREDHLIQAFRDSLDDRSSQSGLYRVPLCSIRPFFFLDHPFPMT
jgi:hypothetical protein